MSLRRYAKTPILGLGEKYGTSYSVVVLRENIKNGNIRIDREIVLQGSERLDTLAGKYLGSGDLWWVIGAASNVGYGLQLPPGTVIKIPLMSDVGKYL